MRADFHMHTEFSDDSATPMEAQIERAIELGLDEICITDHVDYGLKTDWEDGPVLWREVDGSREILKNVPYEEYLLKLDRMQRTYGDRIAVRKGLELGVQTHTLDAYRALADRYWDRLDFCLLSVHQIGDLEFWTDDYQRGKTKEQYNHGYYVELLDVMRAYDGYDVLAHLDHIARYDGAAPLAFEAIEQDVEQVLAFAIERGKGIEINTSSWAYGLPDTTPSKAILGKYREMGGEIVTMGSDAHSPAKLAQHFDDAREVLKDLGYERFYTFEKHEPVAHAL
jgi:histidinol-phosphatase (PHP family)